MKEYTITRTIGYFGIKDENNKNVVKCEHQTKELAIEELKYYLLENVKRQFLDFKMTIDEIEEQIQKLLTQTKYEAYKK